MHTPMFLIVERNSCTMLMTENNLKRRSSTNEGGNEYDKMR